MNSWHQFLASEGATALSPARMADGFAASLTDLGVISVTGEDAATFLHSQLTNDVQHLTPAEARLAGYCSPKGRLMATFLMWRNAESVFLQLPRELQPALQKRLSMFVLRAKAKLSDATPEATIGFGGARAPAVLESLFGTLPPAPNTKIDHPLGTLIRLPDGFGAPRYMWLAAPGAGEQAWPALSQLALGGADSWQLAAIHAGVPQVTARTQEQFVPQMVNLELLGGVNFKKGCYPGQEIVARSQYLGKLKRRTALASIAGQAQAGDEVFSLVDPGQPCGMVVNAASNGNGGVDALVEMKLGALDDDVRLGSADGPRVDFLPMPYPLDALEV
ncbi:YgfZ/GcvT domain-containing protein [Pseudoduganella sp. GCM10020061]|uniref:CAF17-like 4Fe-4S cluster assembly/insertion protein YgfZ n=1 Tax=Pseudoduganella sp. GCM10020061 TaxID=3317345 RepID=UPI003629411B